MDLQSLRDASFSRDANAEISGAVSHQQIMNYRQALERKLQQRTPREQLINQGIMPAAATSTAAALLSQKTKLERAKTGDFLQKKIRVRPNRDQLIQRHILNDTSVAVDPSLLANQIKLKRKKLEDDLNERLAIRPGPLELVKENILEQGTPVGLAVQEGNVSFTDTANSSLLEPISPESNDGGSPEPSPDTTCSNLSQLPPTTVADLLNHNNLQAALSILPKTIVDKVEGHQSIKKERTRKKSPKQKFKKYKYHEYRPPNGEVQKCNLPMDSPYALMLQQQQLYLQLQVLYQNYPQFVSLPSIPENTIKPMNNNNVEEEKPVKIEDMRVVDMRKELKMRGLPVSGSKTDLIERLKASQIINDVNTNSPDPSMSDTSSVGSPGIVVSSAAASASMGSPVMSTSSAPGTASIINTHNKLGRSNSLPAHEARLQQVQMQLMANCKKLQTQLPPEVQQQLQHLQYLNLQTHLQQLRVQPQNGNQTQSSQYSPKQSIPLGNQQASLSPVKREPNSSNSCAFSQQQAQAQQHLFNPVCTSSGTFFSHPQVMDQNPKITMTQAAPTSKYRPMEQQQNIPTFVSGTSQPGMQGLLHLKAEANRLNAVASHSEPDMSQNIESQNNSRWNKGVKHTQDNKILSPPHGSPCQTPIIFTSGVHQQQEQQSRNVDSAILNQARMKPDQLARSYSEHSSEDSGNLIHAANQDKQRSLSEPAHPFMHRRSCSLPSDQLFFEHIPPPPSYEAHMAAQMQRKLSQDYTYQQQQPGMPLKAEDMEGKEAQMATQLQRKCSQDYSYQQQQAGHTKAEDMDMNIDTTQDRELTKELQRATQAMMKQPHLDIDSDEILEILGASVGSSVGSPDLSNSQQMMHSPVHPRQPSPQRFVQNPPYQQMSSIPKSPSTGYLSVYSPPNNNSLPMQSRLSKSCEDVIAPYNGLNAKQSMQFSTENTLADIDSIIMSPSSPMRIDTDTEDHLMSISNTIPIPNGGANKTDPLGWLDLNSPPIMTTSPNSTTEVTYINRSSPPSTLYGASPSLHNEHLNLPLFELDNTGQNNFSHDFSEAMDFCV